MLPNPLLIQPRKKIKAPLLHKPYWNRVTLSQDYVPLKSFKSLGLWSPNKHKVDLSYEALNIDFGQEAAKISEVKVGGQKKYGM